MKCKENHIRFKKMGFGRRRSNYHIALLRLHQHFINIPQEMTSFTVKKKEKEKKNLCFVSRNRLKWENTFLVEKSKDFPARELSRRILLGYNFAIIYVY